MAIIRRDHAAAERFLRLKFDEDIPLSRRRELVRVVLARADAWINPPRPQDNPFRSFFTILRCVFEIPASSASVVNRFITSHPPAPFSPLLPDCAGCDGFSTSARTVRTRSVKW